MTGLATHHVGSKRLNILQIISGRSVNGALVYCKILSERLVELGHKVTIVCRPGAWIGENVDQNKIQVVESTMARFPPTEFKRIRNLVKQEKIDLIHSHMTRAQNYAIALKLFTGIPVIATAHNSHFEVHWNFNDFVIANSQFTFDHHSRINRIPQRRMETIHCCSDFERFGEVSKASVQRVHSRLRVSPNDFLVCIAGEIATRKGHVHFVKALPRIVERIPNLKAVFVGRFGRKQPHVRQIRKMILESGMANRIKWVGRQENVADYMAASEVSIVPSLEEPLGLVAIESLMSNTAVIASETGGLTEIIKHNETGLLVPAADHNALANAVIKLADHPALRTRLALQGKQFVSEKFAPNHLLDRVEQVYHRILANRPATAAA